jgi:hypothetical protein
MTIAVRVRPVSHRSKPLSWKSRSAAQDSGRVADHYQGGNTFQYASSTTISGSVPRAASDGSNASDQGLAVFRNGCTGLEGDKRRLRSGHGRWTRLSRGRTLDTIRRHGCDGVVISRPSNDRYVSVGAGRCARATCGHRRAVERRSALPSRCCATVNIVPNYAGSRAGIPG